jgi:hypothetical protein
MNIPLYIVKKGEAAVNKYVELAKQEKELYEKNYELADEIRKQIRLMNNVTNDFIKDWVYLGSPSFNEEEGEWTLPDINKVSRLNDEIWTLQHNLETALVEFSESSYKYINVSEKLKELL